MNQPFNYEAEALQTLSNQFHDEKVSLSKFVSYIEMAAMELADLDDLKKAIFYGKCSTQDLNRRSLSKFRDQVTEDSKTGEHIIHGIIGIATEAGELLEALVTCAKEGTPIDKVNLKEEMGDVFWYMAVLAKACGTSFEEIQRTNIAKLRARFPNKFTEYDAQNRNLAVERAILEGSCEDC